MYAWYACVNSKIQTLCEIRIQKTVFDVLVYTLLLFGSDSLTVTITIFAFSCLKVELLHVRT